MRLTPARGAVAIARPTPVRGSIVIAPPAAPAVAPAAQHSLRERARLRSGSVDLLLFSVGQEWFGVELAVVEEAIDLPAIRHVPEMPPAMLGVITVRGALASVYSPASALGITLGASSSALVFRRPRGRLGIAVDDVDDVHTLDLAQLRDAPATDSGDGIVLGVLRHRDTLLALVDAEALIAACQTVPVLETA
jgi:chemotaxis signal transduction protein